MGIYKEHILPHMINCGCGMKPVMALREKVVPLAFGDVLEVGMGSGLNLSFYQSANVNKVWGLEPSEGMRRRAQKNLAQSPVTVEWLDLPGERVPLADDSVDSIVLTFTMCSIPDWRAALEQMHRVLKPAGKLFFCEHGLAPDASVQKWQQRLNPYWNRVFDCNLNRPVINYLEQGGFNINWHEDLYVEHSPKPLSYMSYGEAVKP